MELILATNNQGKVKEVKEKLVGWKVYSLKDKQIEIEIEEDGLTFEENALKKARTIANLTGMLTMADDSGLEVEYLNNAPGIYSARYGGEGLDDVQRYEKLLDEMKHADNRNARFVSVIALCYPEGRDVTLRGECPGIITDAPMGEGGFGYDPIFLYAPLNKTFGQISLEEKNKISHRARALEKLQRFLNNQPCQIENDLLCAQIVDRGAEIRHLTQKNSGNELLNTDLESWNYTAPILFPILARPFDGKGYCYKGTHYDMHPHGFARESTFLLKHAGENTATFILSETEDTLKQYPFRFYLEVTYTLNGAHLHTEYRVKNTDDKPLFFNIGAHDAYRIRKDYENYTIEYEKEEDLKQNRLLIQKESNPASEYVFPDKAKLLPLFYKENRAVSYFSENLRSSWVQLLYKNKPVVRVSFDKDNTDSLGFWNQPGSEFYCIEPWAGISELFQNTNVQEEKRKIRYLQPGETQSFWHDAEFFL